MDPSSPIEDWNIVQPTEEEMRDVQRANEARKEAARIEEEKRWYKYEELPSARHFRLLRLFARQNDPSIRCKLMTFDVDSSPLHTAVSYRWGDGIACQLVYIQGKRFVVRQNLFDLLNAVRHGANDCWLWVDAICINQQSNEERNQQVKLMGEIYSKANRVLAWLGAGDQNINNAFKFIMDATEMGVGSYCRSIGKKALGNGWYTKEDTWELPWDYIGALSNLTYWTRKWIVQEVILAKSVVLKAGPHELGMRHLEDFFGQLQQNPYIDANGNHDSRWASWDGIVRRLQLRHGPAMLLAGHRIVAAIAENALSSLFDLLLRYEHLECQEPSDNVYALFNLIGEHRTFLEIDYSQSPADRYLAIVKFVTTHEPEVQPQLMQIATVLRKQLCPKTEASVQQALMDKIDLELLPLPTTAIYCGEAKFEKESIKTTSLRKFAVPMGDMPRLRLQKQDSIWKIQDTLRSIMQELPPSTDLVSPQDLCCFVLQGDLSDRDQSFGLATCEIREADQVWHFEHARFAFVVRPLKPTQGPDCCHIVGRAAIFKQKNFDKPPEQEAFFTPVLEPTTMCSEQQMALTCSELFFITVWSDIAVPKNTDTVEKGA